MSYLLTIVSKTRLVNIHKFDILNILWKLYVFSFLYDTKWIKIIFFKWWVSRLLPQLTSLVVGASQYSTPTCSFWDVATSSKDVHGKELWNPHPSSPNMSGKHPSYFPSCVHKGPPTLESPSSHFVNKLHIVAVLIVLRGLKVPTAMLCIFIYTNFLHKVTETEILPIGCSASLLNPINGTWYFNLGEISYSLIPLSCHIFFLGICYVGPMMIANHFPKFFKRAGAIAEFT